MKFINNTSDSIRVVVYTYATATDSSGTDDGDITIESGDTLDLFFRRDATYIVFRAYKGTSTSICLVPYINGIATEGKSGHMAARADPTIIDTLGARTIEYNANSSEVSNSTRWAIHTTAVPDIVGKSYQLNDTIAGLMIPHTGGAGSSHGMQLIGTIKNSALEHEFNLTEVSLYISTQTVMFYEYGGGVRYPSFFYHTSYGWQWKIVTGNNGTYIVSNTEPPVMTITGGEEGLYYSIWEWLNLNATEIKQTDTKPCYLRKNGAWVKQNAYERQNGEWVQISYAD